MSLEERFYGSVTVGERGQVVIPSEARSELDIHPGDKLLVMKHPIYCGLMVFKIDSAREFLEEFRKKLDEFEPDEVGEAS